MFRNTLNVIRVTDEAGRQQALFVMRAIYRDEKGWVQNDEKLISAADLGLESVSWFVVRDGERPVGVLRVLYEPPLELYKEYGFKVVAKGIDLDAFIRSNRIAEIGRFAVLPEYRNNIRVVLALMNAASKDTVEREFTHYITDVFEGEEHSPYDFHSRVMGFEVVATHDTGELNCPCRRITMLLDLRKGYRRLAESKSWVYRAITNGWEEHHHRYLRGELPVPAAVAK
jgi:hypothetical protein